MNAQSEAEARSASGLVHLSTSGTLIALDPQATRIARMRAGTLTAARRLQLDHQSGGHRYKVAMITTTYAPDVDWSPRHISRLMRHIRQYLKRRGFQLRYVWVAELQKRGAVHHHILVWLPKGITLPKPDKKGWWQHGYTKIEWARNAVGYVAKYVSKAGDHAHKFPRGLRLHSCGGLSPRSASIRRWWLLPAWIRERFSSVDDPRRVIGGGFGLRSTGEWFPSPWQVLRVNGVFCCYAKEYEL